MSEKINIAIVDDHLLFRKSLTILINLFPGYKVIFDASDGTDFISQLAQNDLPHIVLMDISMPVMDGYDTTAWLRSNHPDINVLALSTMDTDSAIIKMIKSGAKGYVLKDAEPSELRRAFDEVINLGYFFNELVTRKVMKSINYLTETKNSVGIFTSLSEREIEFLKLTCTELTYKEIGEKLYVSSRTVEGYRDTLCEKLDLKTRVGLAMYAIKNHLVNL
jgi:DNA-binding NarL/FixJ family response regulator